MSEASDVELLMLDLINEERTSRGLDPLQINNALNTASEDHSQWMLDTDTFSHTGAGGSSATDRIAAEYPLEGSWRTAENIGWQSERGAPGIEDDVAQIHDSLMDSPGHRANLLNPDLEDIGIGIEVGDFTTQGREWEAVMITQNFGSSDAVQAPPPSVSDDQDAPTETPVVPPEEETPSDDGPDMADNDTDDVTPPAPDMPEPGPVPEDDMDIPDETDEDDDTDVAEDDTPAGDDVPDTTDDDMPDDDDETDVADDDDADDTADQGEDEVPPEDDTDVADLPDDLFDCPVGDGTTILSAGRLTFDFVDMFVFDDMGDGTDTFTGTVAGPDGTTTTADRAEFNDLITDLFADFGPGRYDMDFG
ncbi:CAP domain-containing protein [Yoonia sp. 2307UL14-13]|uniref:CAP domain-containing protein n=1 Tax=Yoonia sp. 2307UL14-13 TaxID=3126506 RepID=UPI0030AAE64F